MGVEYRIIRQDNKTIFDIGKRLGSEDLLDCIYSQEQLLEFLIIWQVQMWEAVADPIYALIIRDRMLDFVEGSKYLDLKIVGDSWWDGEVPECIEYTFTHDRYVIDEDVDSYRQGLQNISEDEYTGNPVNFFRVSGISKGKYIDDNNRRKQFWRP